MGAFWHTSAARIRDGVGSMGAILAVLGEAEDPALAEHLERMIAVSPYRGTAERIVTPGAAMAIQTLGWDASIVSRNEVTVAFHGYIGNWNDIERASGIEPLVSGSDAARIGAAYVALGESLFARLRGEFATAILDRRTNEVLAVRSVSAGRPLVFAAAGGRVYLGSEIRQVLGGSSTRPEMDDEYVVSWLAEEFDDLTRTAFCGVRQVVPGCISRFSFPPRGSSGPQLTEFWSPPPTRRGPYDVRELAEDLRRRLAVAVRRTLPQQRFALFLSGGVDSSTVWGLIAACGRDGRPDAAQPGRPISAIYPGWRCDETPFIAGTHRWTRADGLFVNATNARAGEYLPRMATVCDWMDAPQGIAQELLALRAVEDGRQIVLDGYGGDEWLRGSLNYLADLLATGRIVPWLRDSASLDVGVRRALRQLVSVTIPFRPRFWRRRQRVRPRWIGQAYREPRAAAKPPGAGSRHWQGLFAELTTVRSGVTTCPGEQELARLGVECRSPLMDLDLVEFGFSTPGRAVTGGVGFNHLYRLAVQDLLSPEVRVRGSKSEFSEVFFAGLRESLQSNDARNWRLVERGVLDLEGIRALVDRLPGDPPDVLAAIAWWGIIYAELLARRLS